MGNFCTSSDYQPVIIPNKTSNINLVNQTEESAVSEATERSYMMVVKYLSSDNIKKIKVIQNSFRLFQIRAKNLRKIIYSDLSTYIGSTQEQRPHGFGVVLAGKSKIIGEFENGQLNGFVVQYLGKEMIFQGYVVNNKRSLLGIEFDKQYTAITEFDGDVRNGIGQQSYFDGSLYSGEFKSNKRNGRGELKSNETTYWGGFTEDVFNNFGILTWDDKIYVGGYKLGLRDGLGLLLYTKESRCLLASWKEDVVDDTGYLIANNKVSKVVLKGSKKTFEVVETIDEVNREKSEQIENCVFEIVQIVNGDN